MKCHRCGSMMVYERFYGPHEHFVGWRCILCGEIIDQVILDNRHAGSNGENRNRRKKWEWFTPLESKRLSNGVYFFFPFKLNRSAKVFSTKVLTFVSPLESNVPCKSTSRISESGNHNKVFFSFVDQTFSQLFNHLPMGGLAPIRCNQRVTVTTESNPK